MTPEGGGDAHPQLNNLMCGYIAGIDEVGKGALFGPVFAGAVILDKESEEKLRNAGVKDSKKLTSKKRWVLAPLIQEFSNSWSIGEASAQEIDLMGIRQATEHAMIRAVHGLTTQPELLLIDGNLPLRPWKGAQKTCIKGEDKFLAIAAASVLAKVARDLRIIRLANKFPNYGLDTNVGYGTSFHREAIIQSGPTKFHRKTFLSKIKYK